MKSKKIAGVFDAGVFAYRAFSPVSFQKEQYIETTLQVSEMSQFGWVTVTLMLLVPNLTNTKDAIQQIPT